MDTNWRDIRDQTHYSPERFTPKVYQEVMADEPRLGGADVFQGARRRESHRGLWRGERKQQRAVELIKAGEFHSFPDALRFALAAAFTSKNAGEFLKSISLDVFAAERGLLYDFIHEGMTLLNLFDADISGRDFEHGKPHPMIFQTAPQEPGFPPEHCSWSRTPPQGCRRARWPRWEWRG